MGTAMHNALPMLIPGQMVADSITKKFRVLLLYRMLEQDLNMVMEQFLQEGLFRGPIPRSRTDLHAMPAF